MTQHISEMCGNWGNIYAWELSVLSFMKVQFQLISIFLSYFCLICKLWNFGHLHICGQCLCYRISSTFLYKIYRLIQKKEFSSSAILLAIFCWLINCTSWMSWNYASYFSYVQRIKHCLCLRPFSVFIHEKFSSNYYLSF